MIGQTISHYKILDKLGEGGMGIVYKAHDTKLKRTVALKFLPSELTSDNEAKQRFIHEAQAASALDHPNICTVYEINETKAGSSFIAMAYYEGETLKNKLKKGPLKIGEAIEIGVQLAQGLARAHEAGIVHRDIKPANIMITNRGEVKIVDFGLAKLGGMTKLTRAGSTLGTAAYMSPEQVRGDDIDCRTDIWSLGVVLYEMLAGRLPFKGDHEAAILYEIVNVELLPLSTVRIDINPDLDRIVSECLTKNLDERYQSIKDVLKDLKRFKKESESKRLISVRVATSSGQEGVYYQPNEMIRKSKKMLNRTWIITFGVIIVLIAATVIVLQNSKRTTLTSTPSIHTSILLPQSSPVSLYGSASLGVARPSIALSPDGSKLVYVGKKGNNYLLYLRQMSNHEVIEMGGTEGAYAPFFSPGGEWVGFFAGGELKKTSVINGHPITICRIGSETRGACWSLKNQIYISEDGGTSLQAVSGNGGTPEVIIKSQCMWPDLLPGENHILVTTNDDSIRIIDIQKKEFLRLSTIIGSTARYVRSGHILYCDKGTLMAVPFDVGSFDTKGDPFPLISGVRAQPGHRVAHYTVSLTGLIAYIYSLVEPKAQFYWIDRLNKLTKLSLPADDYRYMGLSPDGTKIATIINRSQQELWIYDLISNSRSILRTRPVLRHIIWGPQSNFVTYLEFADNTYIIQKQSINAGSEPYSLIKKPFSIYPNSWGADGKWLSISWKDSTFIVHAEGDSVNISYRLKDKRVFFTFSPDADYVAYVLDKEKIWQVYIEPFPPTSERWQVSTEGGEEPVWSSVGNELFFRWGRQWNLASVTLKPKFSMSLPRNIFEGNYINIPMWSYASSPDSKKFLVLKDLNEQEEYSEIRVISNIFSLLSESKTDLIPE